MAGADGVVSDKLAWRAAVAALFRLMPAAGRGALDEALNKRLFRTAAEAGKGLALAFSPLPDEPDITGFLRMWLASGGELALPAWNGGPGMAFRRVTDIDGQLRPGKAGILEPSGALGEAPPAEAALAIVPGRAFSESCDRLGRGGGCYDALLAGGDLPAIGVAYDFQVFPGIPRDGRDVPVDMIVTPSRIVRAGGMREGGER